MMPKIMDADVTHAGFREHPVEHMTDVPLFESRARRVDGAPSRARDR